MFVCVHFLLFRTHVKDTVLCVCVFVLLCVSLSPSRHLASSLHSSGTRGDGTRPSDGPRGADGVRDVRGDGWRPPGAHLAAAPRPRLAVAQVSRRRRWVWLVWRRPRGSDLASFVWQSGSRHQHGLPVDDCRVQCVSLMFNSKAKSLSNCCTWYRKNHLIFTQTRILTRVQTNGIPFQRIKVFSERLHFFFRNAYWKVDYTFSGPL